MRYLIFLLFLPLYGFSQLTIAGKIVDNASGKAIPYATIGLAKQNTGTNANEKGEFIINCQQPGIDSLIISSVGYITVRLPVKEFINNTSIALTISEKILKPVTIKNHWSYSEVGKYRDYQNYCFTSNGYQSQVARKLSAPEANSCLQEIQVRTSKHGGNARYRVRVYDYDSLTKGPAQELTDTIIQVTAKPGLSKIDMSGYQICLPQKEFFVSIEWLIIPFNENRFIAKYEGGKKEFLNYHPCICFTKDASVHQDELWGLNYSNRWYLMFKDYQKNSLAVSAIVKY